GRAEEQVSVVTLADFDPQAVDMLTIVLIGASTSKAFARGDGTTVAFTPRGYAGKAAEDPPGDRPVPAMGTSDAAYRSAIKAGVAFLRERARHTQVAPRPDADKEPTP